MYTPKLRQTYVTADLIRKAARDFKIEDFKRLLSYCSSPEEAKMLLFEEDEQGRNALFYAIHPYLEDTPYATFPSPWVNFNNNESVAMWILETHYVREDRYAALCSYIQDQTDTALLSFCSSIPGYLNYEALFSTLDNHRFRFDRAMLQLIEANHLKSDARVTQLIHELWQFKDPLFDKKTHIATVNKIKALFEQVEVAFEYELEFHYLWPMFHKFLTCLAYVVSYFSLSAKEAIQAYHTSTSQKILDSSQIYCSFFGDKTKNPTYTGVLEEVHTAFTPQ